MFSSSPTEKRDLIIGTVIFVLVEMSFAIYYTNTLIELLVLGILTIPLWLFHELAHKFVAQGNGLISDFRLDPNMALFSLFSILLPIKIIAPGVVLSKGGYQLDTAGRISIAGPLTNILIGGIFLVFSAFMPVNWAVVILLASRFSFDMALFNMLPFYVLDGAKVLQWNQSIFFLIFSLSAISWLFHPLGILGFLGGY
jgi:Zn-dependent protease